MSKTNHQQYISLALELAERGRLTVSPNPMVGCVIVKNNTIVGQGYHQRAGDAHAEINALRNAGSKAENATMYVTLEPCCHVGKTPPCVNAIIQAQIKKVVVACLDPNPLMSGKSISILQNAGIEVDIGICEQEAKTLNEIFFHYITTKRPFVIAKWAMSIDGQTITHPEDNRQISCAESHKQTHHLREQVDAILIGANTARVDNPLLTVRLGESPRHHPIRIILSSTGQLPENLNLFSHSLPAKTIIVATEKICSQLINQYQKNNIELLIIKSNQHGQVDIKNLLEELGKRHITSLLVEGGMTIHQHFFAEKLVNKIHVYIAPVFIGKTKTKIPVRFSTIKNSGADIVVTGIHGEKQYV
ncbi:MAG: Pyrimidine reductase/pyrimidine deaminase [uncultured bacterium]|nr:MAG: Pyrimidine reductase/pyrimidine deaminase [uncultured bacterium]